MFCFFQRFFRQSGNCCCQLREYTRHDNNHGGRGCGGRVRGGVAALVAAANKNVVTEKTVATIQRSKMSKMGIENMAVGARKEKLGSVPMESV